MKTCKICGARLDPQERCGCVSEAAERLEYALRQEDEEMVREAEENALKRIRNLGEWADMDYAEECENLLRLVDQAEYFLDGLELAKERRADELADRYERWEDLCHESNR